jgi:hypothetical protein
VRDVRQQLTPHAVHSLQFPHLLYDPPRHVGECSAELGNLISRTVRIIFFAQLGWLREPALAKFVHRAR